MDTYFLSTEVEVRLSTEAESPTQRWMQVPGSGIVRPAYVMLAGDTATIADGLVPARHSMLMVQYGAAHSDLSPDGAGLSIWIESGNLREQIGAVVVAARGDGILPREAWFSLGDWAGKQCRVVLHADAGPQGDARGDWIALYELAVAPTEAMALTRARAYRTERTRNELAHFAHVYDHAMYAVEAPKPDRGIPCTRLYELLAGATGDAHGMQAIVGATDSVPEERRRDAYHFAHTLLAGALGTRPPDFPARLRARHHAVGRPLEILSLCCGAARIEASIAKSAGVPAQWTLMDLNENLLYAAAANFPPGSDIRLVVGDLNDLRDYGHRYDVIACVSGLHHIVELERVIGFVRDALVDGGEFWSIGEAIGRNGNRLWPNDYAAANIIFRGLPERLRLNRATGQVDDDLPDIDCSSGTFEGIRSEDIEPLLSRFLEPVELYRRNCFLWRIVNLAYADNYDLTDETDLQLMRGAVCAELEHFRSGGRATELHGVFRRPGY